MMRRGSPGTSATRFSCLSLVSSVQVLPPERPLRQPEERAAAPRADVLIVAAAGQLVAKTQLLLDGREVAHHQLRRIRLPAAPARGLRRSSAGVLVEADAELRRSLEHVKELAERQPEQRDDHGGRMQDREELV